MTKAQRDAAKKTVEKPVKKDMRLKENKLGFKDKKQAMVDANTAPKTPKTPKAVKSEMKTEKATGPNVPYDTIARFDALVNYTTCLMEWKTSNQFAKDRLDATISDNLTRLEAIAEQLHPLEVNEVVAEVEEKAMPFHSDPVPEPVKAPVAMSAPIPFNPAVPPNGS